MVAALSTGLWTPQMVRADDVAALVPDPGAGEAVPTVPSNPSAADAPADGSQPPDVSAASEAIAGPEPQSTADTATIAPAPGATGVDSADGSGASGSKEKLGGVRIAVGGRAGYGVPFGEAVDNQDMSDAVSGSIPLMFDAAARMKNGTELGLYVQLAFGLNGDELDRDCADCSVFDLHFGLQLNHHLNSTGFLDPWAGIGVGLNTLTVSESRQITGITTSGQMVEVDITRSTSLKALPEATLQFGVDIGGDPIAFGPYIAVSAARFSDRSTEVKCSDFRCSDLSFRSGDEPIPNAAWHAWLSVGVRGNYLLL